MILAFLLGPIAVGSRPLDFARLEDDPRGLTGTDNSFFGYATAMAARGHDVTLFVAKQREVTEWRGCTVRPYEERRIVDTSWDAALAWNDIEGLRDVSPRVLRCLNTQINDYTYTRPDQHANVDAYLSPSAALAKRLEPMAREQGGTGTWYVTPNGCDPDIYDLGAKVPGRCIYASSPDRGMHVALEQWPRIRGAVPHATLRIFYHTLQHWFDNVAIYEKSALLTDREHLRRVRIVQKLLPELEPHGVSVVGGVSRRQMAREFSEAQCLAYPVDTISFTEGFAVSILEGCAAGAVPCVSSCDAIGEVYGRDVPMVRVDEGCHRFLRHPELAQLWADYVIGVLTDAAWRDGYTTTGRAFAARHAWPVLAERLEKVIVEGKAHKS